MTRKLDSVLMHSKICSRCNTSKPLTEFGIDNRRNNPKAICKECDTEVHRLRYYDPANQDKVKVQMAKRNQYTLSRFAEKKAGGICYSCDKKADAGLYCSEHAKQRRDKAREGRKENRPVCQDCGVKAVPLGRRRCCDECANTTGQVFRTKQKRWHDKEKDYLFEQYGGYRCVCCGETEKLFLTLDHVNDDGARHREEIGSAGLYRWIKRHGYPPGFQVMCQNCNRGKWMNGGICPHQQKPTHPIDEALRRLEIQGTIQ